MSQVQRKKLIEKIEKMRGSKVITLVTSNRPNIRSDIESADIVNFREHLDDICTRCKSLDLFLYSYGGELEAAWQLVNLFWEYNVDFSVLIPYHARSAATLIAFGAKEIVMGKMGALGPIDPTIEISGGPLGGMEISAADMDSYEDFLRKEYQVTEAGEKAKAFQKLTETVSPILIGKAYRNFLETKSDAKKLLQRNITSPKKINAIIDCFMKGIHTHNHSISRAEARTTGLNIAYTDASLEKELWDLYKTYERDMSMDIPYIDTPPHKKAGREIPFTYIESEKITSKKIGKQKFKKLDFPEGSTLTVIDNKPAVYLPNGTAIPIGTDNQLITSKGLIYEKSEDVYWVHE